MMRDITTVFILGFFILLAVILVFCFSDLFKAFLARNRSLNRKRAARKKRYKRKISERDEETAIDFAENVEMIQYEEFDSKAQVHQSFSLFVEYAKITLGV